MAQLDKICALVQEIFISRFRDASFCFLAGSYVRQEHTAYSDLDLVVFYPRIECAFRESFFFKDIQ